MRTARHEIAVSAGAQRGSDDAFRFADTHDKKRLAYRIVHLIY